MLDLSCEVSGLKSLSGGNDYEKDESIIKNDSGTS